MGDFFQENKKLVQEYLKTQFEIYRLKGVKAISKIVGYLLWFIVSLFLVGLAATFAGLVLGFWLSDLLHSHIWGFGLTTLVMIAVILLLAAFRRTLFVNPIIRAVLKRTQESGAPEPEDEALPNL